MSWSLLQINLAFYVEKEVIRMLFVIPEVEKPIKIIDTDVRSTIDENGNMAIIRKMDAVEIAELFDMPLSYVLNGAAKLGICTIEEGEEIDESSLYR